MPVSNTCKDTMASYTALQQHGVGVSTASVLLSAAYLCPLKRLPGAILYTRSALANVEGVVEKGPILCCELKSPVPNRGEFQALFITQLNIFADSKFLKGKHIYEKIHTPTFSHACTTREANY